MDGFWQIRKYIGEGKFRGIFSAVQMFVISNGVNTKYFSAAGDTELNPKFAEAYHERGRAKLLNGDKEGSAEDMKKGLELNPKEIQNFNGQYGNQPEGRTGNILGL